MARCSIGLLKFCARRMQVGRLDKAWKREERRFRQDYNDKLFNGLILVLLVDIVVSRFLLKSNLLESIGWILFIFLQVRLPQAWKKSSHCQTFAMALRTHPERCR